MNIMFSYNTLRSFLKTKKIERSEIEKAAGMVSNSNDDRTAVDAHGMECAFLYGFITHDFEKNFWNIAEVYLKHRYDRLDEFMKQGWLKADSIRDTTPEQCTIIRILNLMLNGAKAGDKYSRTMLVNLYEAYHNEEYIKIRNLKKISANDIIKMMGNKSEIEVCTVSRIIVMSGLMGIETDQTCFGLYEICNRIHEDTEEEYNNTVCFYKYDSEKRQWTRDLVDKMIEEYEGDPDKIFEYEEKARNFVNLCFGNSFYPQNYDLKYKSIIMEDRKTTYATTIEYLWKAFPHEPATFRKVQEFSVLLGLANSFTKSLDIMDNSIYKLLGIWHSRYKGESDWSMKISPEKLEEGLEEK